MPDIVNVDWAGEDANGERYDLEAAPDKVAAGLMINQPVLVRFPDGRLLRGNRQRITPAGLEAILLAMHGQLKGNQQ